MIQCAVPAQLGQHSILYPGTILIGDSSVMIEVTLKGKALQSRGETLIGRGLVSMPLTSLS
jgi:hypothetical protein